MRASNHDWDGVKALTLFPPLADRNVVYNFHYYAPMTLTHQGAAWTSGASRILHDVPYPSSPEIVRPLLEKFSEPQAKRALSAYGVQNWNKQRILEDIGRVAEWAKRNNVFVTCNEFGVYRRVAPLSARINYTRNVREVLEHYGIGWTIWNSSFGFLARQGGRTSADKDIIRALGLKD